MKRLFPLLVFLLAGCAPFQTTPNDVVEKLTPCVGHFLFGTDPNECLTHAVTGLSSEEIVDQLEQLLSSIPEDKVDQLWKVLKPLGILEPDDYTYSQLSEGTKQLVREAIAKALLELTKGLQ
jgi:hypothetical protein